MREDHAEERRRRWVARNAEWRLNDEEVYPCAACPKVCRSLWTHPDARVH